MNLVQREEKRRKEIEARALAFSIAQKSARYVRSLQVDNSRLHSKVQELEAFIATLKTALTVPYKEALQHEAAREFTRVLISRFMDSAVGILKENVDRDLVRIAEYFMFEGDRRFPVKAMELFDHILELAEVDVEPINRMSSVRESKFTVHLYWPRNAEFRYVQSVGDELSRGVHG